MGCGSAVVRLCLTLGTAPDHPYNPAEVQAPLKASCRPRKLLNNRKHLLEGVANRMCRLLVQALNAFEVDVFKQICLSRHEPVDRGVCTALNGF